MEKVLSGDEKIRRAEEIYYRRKMGIPSSKFSKIEGEKKSYLGSKILLQILVIINLCIIIIAIQNKEYIFTEKFLNDVQKYNINITEIIKDFIGIETEEIIKSDENNETNQEVNQKENQEMNPEINVQESMEQTKNNIEEIVPNNDAQASSLNQMEEEINNIKGLVSIQKPIYEGTVTSRFGARESTYKNVEGYHTGIDIGATKRDICLCSYISV